jgi:hypothetical protein
MHAELHVVARAARSSEAGVDETPSTATQNIPGEKRRHVRSSRERAVKMNEERKRARLSVAAMSARTAAIPGGFPLLSPAGGGRRAGQCSWEM